MPESETITVVTPTVIVVTADPARRPDVLFRVRRDPGSRVSAWWMVGAFILTSAVVVAAISLLPAEI